MLMTTTCGKEHIGRPKTRHANNIADNLTGRSLVEAHRFAQARDLWTATVATVEPLSSYDDH